MILCDAVTAISAAVGLGMVPAPAGLAPLPVIARAPTRPPAVSELFDILFDDIGMAPTPRSPTVPRPSTPDVPEEVLNPEDAGAWSRSASSTAASTAIKRPARARRSPPSSSGCIFYAVLNRKAATLEIENAYIARTGESDHSAVLKDPRDKARLDELNAAYSAAREVLVDERKRTVPTIAS